MRITGAFLLVMFLSTAGCQQHLRGNLPPSDMLQHPGPGVEGPGPGVMMYQPPTPQVGAVSQIQFSGPEGMTIHWDVTAPGRFDSEPLVAPARYNFPQGLMYRLKLANIPGRPGVELYPSIELGFAMPRSEAFLAHNAIPIQFTEEDFDQVLQGNFVTKVIYLPDPEFQELALSGVETLVSTRLEPGTDPIIEAERKGAILAILRLGNKDMQLPGGAGGAEGGYPGMGGPCPVNPFVAGVTAPQYGMPMSGTPIGLVGPPHIPLGVPAGLQSHTIVNHTRMNIAKPIEDVRIDVTQRPGMSYPAAVNRVNIVERTTPGREPPCRPCAEGGAPCPSEGDPGPAPSGPPPAPCPSGNCPATSN